MMKRPIDLGLVAEGDRILRDARARDPSALADAVEKVLEGDALEEVIDDADDDEPGVGRGTAKGPQG